MKKNTTGILVALLFALTLAAGACSSPDAAKENAEGPAEKSPVIENSAYEPAEKSPIAQDGIELTPEQAVVSSFLYFEFYQNIPEVRSATRYLSRSSEPVEFYIDGHQHVAYGLHLDDSVINERVASYVKQMESEGYVATQRDATRSSTITLENGTYKIDIHEISDLDAFVADKVLPYGDKLKKDVNIVVEVTEA
ncbi:MAG: hypothetical protein LBC58_04900 [Clostridiales Family XIII bacterium]|nr:hypothetical protein [Clostridiales Family XIII bacterium]